MVWDTENPSILDLVKSQMVGLGANVLCHRSRSTSDQIHPHFFLVTDISWKICFKLWLLLSLVSRDLGHRKSLDRSPSDFPVFVSVIRSFAVVTAYEANYRVNWPRGGVCFLYCTVFASDGLRVIWAAQSPGNTLNKLWFTGRSPKVGLRRLPEQISEKKWLLEKCWKPIRPQVVSM